MYSSTPNLPWACNHTQNKILTPSHCLQSACLHFIRISAQMSSLCPTHLKEGSLNHQSFPIPLYVLYFLLVNIYLKLYYKFMIPFYCLPSSTTMNSRILHTLFTIVPPALRNMYWMDGHMSYEFPRTRHSVKCSSNSFGHKTPFFLGASHENAIAHDTLLGIACLMEFYYQEPFQQ